MNRDKLALFLGFFFLISSIFTGVIALEYEFYLESEMSVNSDVSNEGISEWVEYEELSEESQEYVDRATNGERFLFSTKGDVPGFREPTTGKLAMSQNGTYYIFERGIVFVWRSPAGILTFCLFGIASALFIQSIRWEETG